MAWYVPSGLPCGDEAQCKTSWSTDCVQKRHAAPMRCLRGQARHHWGVNRKTIFRAGEAWARSPAKQGAEPAARTVGSSNRSLAEPRPMSAPIESDKDIGVECWDNQHAAVKGRGEERERG